MGAVTAVEIGGPVVAARVVDIGGIVRCDGITHQRLDAAGEILVDGWQVGVVQSRITYSDHLSFAA